MTALTGATVALGRGPLADARHQLGRAADVLGYDDGLLQVLERSRREITVSLPMRREDGRVEHLQRGLYP